MRILIGFLCTVAAHGADCSSTAAGVWSSPSNWANCNGDVPGNGDTATLSHAITLDSSRIVGTSPSSDSSVLTLNAGGRLTWVEGAVLTVRGSIRIANPSSLAYTLDMAPGAGLHFDPSEAADRTVAAYTLRPSASNSNSVIRMACTLEAPCTVQTLRPHGDEARARFANNGSNSNFIDAQFVNFQDLGSETEPSFIFGMASSAPAHAIISFQWCWFKNIGFIGATTSLASSNGHTVRFNHNYVESLLHSTTKMVAWRTTFSNPIGTGVREIIGNVLPDFGIGGDPSDLPCRGCTIRDNFFRRTYYTSVVGQTTVEIRNNYFGLWQSTSTSIGTSAPIFDSNYIWWRAPGNPHVVSSHGFTGSTAYNRNIFECNNCNDGDVISKNAGDQEVTYTVTNNLMIPANDFYPRNGAALVSIYCVSGARCGFWQIEKNTIAGGSNDTQGRALIVFSELNPDADVTAVRSNAIGGLPGNLGGYPAARQNATTQKVNFVHPDGVTHNGHFNLTPVSRPGESSNGTVYDIRTGGSDPVPGANDLIEPPYYAEPGRNSARWAAAKGYPQSWDGVKQAFIDTWISRRGDETAVRGLIEDIANWVRQGYAPRNLKYATGGHDGGRIGAVAPVAMFGTFNGGH